MTVSIYFETLLYPRRIYLAVMVLAKLYLPKEAKKYEQAEGHVIRWFSEDFDGCTLYDGKGTWLNENDQITQDPVTIFETVSSESRADVRRKVTAVAEGVFDMSDESAILCVVDGEKTLITD